RERRHSAGTDGAHNVAGADAKPVQRASGVATPVLGPLHRSPERAATAGDEPDHSSGRDAERRRALRRVEDPESTAGPRARVHEPATGAQRPGNDVHRAGERASSPRDTTRRTAILGGDGSNQSRRRKTIEVTESRVGLLGRKRREARGSSRYRA